MDENNVNLSQNTDKDIPETSNDEVKISKSVKSQAEII